MTTRGPIIIVGAGVAGLTLAAGLLRTETKFVILERGSDYSEVGAGISLWPNALAALDAIGLGEAVREAGGAVSAGGVQRPDGTWIRRADSTAVERALGEPMLAIHRRDLMRILASQGGSSVRFGRELTSLDVRGDGVRAHLDDGESVEGSGLIGADGIGSTVAKWLDPTLSRSYSGYTAWRGVAPVGVSSVVPSETWGPGCEFGFVPIGRDRTYWFASENTPEGGRSPEGERQHLLRKLEHWHAPIPKLIAATDDQGILRHDIYDRTTISAWSNGPVVVIGDAAHPMRPHMGQGGCQSIEDGVLLAASIGAHPSISSALAEFSQKRARRVHTIVRQSALMGRVIQGEGPIAAATRHLGSRIPMRLLVRSLTRVGGRDAFDHESAGFPTFSE